MGQRVEGVQHEGESTSGLAPLYIGAKDPDGNIIPLVADQYGVLHVKVGDYTMPVTLREGGIAVSNTPHDTLDFTDEGFDLTDLGGGAVRVDLEDSGVVSGSYGDENNLLTLTVDDKGRVTAISTTPLAVQIFGSEYQYAENNTFTTTASTTFQEFLSLTTPSVPAGDYLIQWEYGWGCSDDTAEFCGRVQVDDTVNLLDPDGAGQHLEEPQDAASDQVHIASGFRQVTLTNAAHTIDLDFRRQGPTATARIFYGRLYIYRVA